MEPGVNGVELPSMELYCDRNTGQTSSGLTVDIEDFESHSVSVTETLNQLAPRVADERFQSQIFSLAPQSNLDIQEDVQVAPTQVVEKKLHRPSRPTMLSSSLSTGTSAPHPFSTLIPGALSAILRATLPPHLTSDPKPRREPGAQCQLTLEQLRTELRDLRDEVELMKSQHNKEIQLLMNELDEEKRIRLSFTDGRGTDEEAQV
ncbi:SH3 domain-containing kinase-binding protein 1 isoform X5 [Oncorhynchus mykiss]|uniref:SH3 domain-containing kinase-binding protein 1 isoform X5 n=1 Tax=Oncorhynchus mykiss TaxID=8022 RepID=UPI001877AB0B|nr:SH3 domain-containing kinase-binding protein 1 isoform X5 [Oncorhynchus mykiss]